MQRTIGQGDLLQEWTTSCRKVMDPVFDNERKRLIALIMWYLNHTVDFQHQEQYYRW